MCVICNQSNCLFVEDVIDGEIVESASSSETTSSSSSGYASTDLIDGILSPFSWTAGGDLVYGFTSGAEDYEGGETPNGEAAEFLELSSFGEDMVRAAADAWSDVMGIDLVEGTGSSADIAIGGSAVPSTSWAYLPTSSSYGGDVWFGLDQSFNSLLVSETEEAYIGSYEYFVAMHELGHSLGLKHPQDIYDGYDSGDVTLSSDYDSIEYTVMSYISYTGGSYGAYTVRGDSYPQSLMMLDIAAIQELYGADYSTNSGDTVYSFDLETGAMLVNGVSTGTPGDNIVFRTIWDGDGVDTLDLSNYDTDIVADLNAGGLIDFDADGSTQKAWLGRKDAVDIYASANVYMSLLYDGNTQSLIENIVTGEGDDTVIGNEADNYIDIAGGRNYVDGGAGEDTVVLHEVSAMVLVDYTDGTLRLGYSGNLVEVTDVEYIETENNTFTTAEIIAAWETQGATSLISFVGLGLVSEAEAGGVDNDYAVEMGASMFEEEITALTIDGTEAEVINQASSVQGIGTTELAADGSSITLSDNAWAAALMDITITENTVLSFDFSSSVEGEIQSIGFYYGDDNDWDEYEEQSFQLFGTDSFGLQAFNTYDSADGVTHYEIAVGEYFTGTFDRIIFIGDDDAYVGSISTFSNIEIVDNTPTLTVDGISSELVNQASSVQGIGTTDLAADGSSVTLTDNAWAAALVDVTITEHTVLSFDFSSSVEGEIQSIGFYYGDDNDWDEYEAQSFQLYGTDAFGIQDFNTYDSADGVTHFEINVGDYFTGTFDRIVFIGDDDAYVGADATFSNIEITLDVPSIDIDGAETEVVNQASSIQGIGTTELAEDGSSITLSDNAWAAALVDVTVTEDTVLSFDFYSSAEGEIQSIGFYDGDDNDWDEYEAQTFQLFGTDDFGIQDFNTYDSADGVTHYEINVGDYFTGDFDRIVFIGDDDAYVGSNATFSNIEIL